MPNFLDSIKLSTAPDFLNQEEKMLYLQCFEKLQEIQLLIKKTEGILNIVELPKRLKSEFDNLKEEFYDKKILLANLSKIIDRSQVSSAFQAIQIYHANFFEPSSSNKNMMILNMISHYDQFIVEKSQLDYYKITQQIQEKFTALEQQTIQADNILAKLEQPSASKVLADYAVEYKTESDTNNKNALLWIWGAMTLSALFIFLILESIDKTWFPNLITITDIDNNIKSTHEILNIPVLLTKFMLVSLILFIIVFCFKQYSIYKNLSVINKQKMNAFNSYTLFEAAIGESDKEAKKILLMSLAKTIHE